MVDDTLLWIMLGLVIIFLAWVFKDIYARLEKLEEPNAV